MLFSHYIWASEVRTIITECKAGDYVAAFGGDVNTRDRRYDIVAMAVAGNKECRKALAYGITMNNGDTLIGWPSHKAVNEKNGCVAITDGTTTIKLPVLHTEKEAKRWLKSLRNASERELAKDFLSALSRNAYWAWREMGQYISGVDVPQKPRWLA